MYWDGMLLLRMGENLIGSERVLSLLDCSSTALVYRVLGGYRHGGRVVYRQFIPSSKPPSEEDAFIFTFIESKNLPRDPGCILPVSAKISQRVIAGPGQGTLAAVCSWVLRFVPTLLRHSCYMEIGPSKVAQFSNHFYFLCTVVYL